MMIGLVANQATVLSFGLPGTFLPGFSCASQ
jgi:hypothetical protein